MRDALTEIDGVGEATAEKIMAVVGENTDEPNEWLGKAYTALENGNEDRALVYLKRSK